LTKARAALVTGGGKRIGRAICLALAEADFAAEAAGTLLQKPGSPEAVAAAVRWLVDADMVTGQMIAVDGGQHLAWQTPDILESEYPS
jgi:NAD(P)-dependent dehydrogenase (short-subunit alcohol dehydrogenase family)